MFIMWRQLLHCRSRFKVIVRDEFLCPVLQQKFSTSGCQYVRRSQRIVSEENESFNDKEGSTKSDSQDEGLHRFAGESPQQLLENARTDTDSIPLTEEDIWSDGPYPNKSDKKRSQAKFSQRPQVDPQETSIIVFPGQGTHYVGMGKELLKYPNVKEMYDAASQILGYNLLDLSLNGPESLLARTEHQQPAIMVASLAAIEKLREEHPQALEQCVGVAGYSVGEITALTFAGSFDFEDAIRLVKVRAKAMQYASEITPSGMMSVLYGPDSRLAFACSVAKEFCRRKEYEDVDCRIASYLYPHCKVIAGNDDALSFIVKNKSDFRLKRLKRLPVSGAFHTDLMKPAVEPLQKALSKMHIDPPLIPVHSNVDGKRYRNARQIIKQLPKQMYSPVRWEQTMHILYERNKGTGFPQTFECGPNRSLRTILKMCNAKAWENCKNIEA